MCEFLSFLLALRTIVFYGLTIFLCFFLLAPANAEEEETDTDFTQGRPTTPDSASSEPPKKFKFFTKASTYLRYGGVSVPSSTSLIGYSSVSVTNSGEDRSPLEDFVLNNNYASYGSPIVSLGSFRFDPYELELGFEANTPLSSKLNGGIRASFDALELGEFLSGSDWGGREVYPWHHFSSGPLREGFVYLSHPRWGKLSFGFLDGVASVLDGGARAVAAGGGGLYEGFSRTPWQVHRLGLTLGRASSENFPKVQYLAPSFYGVDIGVEWFTNAQTDANKLLSLPELDLSNCKSSLFFVNDQQLVNSVFKSFHNLISNDFFPDDLPSSIKCWQLSNTSSGWHANTSRFIMGGNLAISYEKSFTENLSLEVAAGYGILFSNASSSESRDTLALWHTHDSSLSTHAQEEELRRIIYKASSIDQALSLGASLRWRGYSFFSGFVYLLPSEYKLENLSQVQPQSNETGITGFIWSLGMKADRLIPTKGGGGKVGEVSLSFAQAVTKDPYFDDGRQQVASLLNVGSSYPLANGVLLVMDYWYGDAALNVPFDIVHYETRETGFTFHQQRLTETHEFTIGLKMEF